MPVVDTEFLFGMRSSDPKHSYVKAILELDGGNLAVPPFAIFELVVVCLSEKKSIDVVIQTLDLIEDIIRRYDLRIMAFEIESIVKGLDNIPKIWEGLF